jgi:hypothetical protein
MFNGAKVREIQRICPPPARRTGRRGGEPCEDPARGRRTRDGNASLVRQADSSPRPSPSPAAARAPRGRRHGRRRGPHQRSLPGESNPRTRHADRLQPGRAAERAQPGGCCGVMGPRRPPGCSRKGEGSAPTARRGEGRASSVGAGTGRTSGRSSGHRDQGAGRSWSEHILILGQRPHAVVTVLSFTPIPAPSCRSPTRATRNGQRTEAPERSRTGDSNPRHPAWSAGRHLRRESTRPGPRARRHLRVVRKGLHRTWAPWLRTRGAPSNPDGRRPRGPGVRAFTVGTGKRWPCNCTGT